MPLLGWDGHCRARARTELNHMDWNLCHSINREQVNVCVKYGLTNICFPCAEPPQWSNEERGVPT